MKKPMINLLPPEQKKELKERESQKIVLILGFLGFLFFLSLTFGLAIIKFYLSGEIIAQKTIEEVIQKELVSKENENAKKEIIKFNKDVTRILSFLKEKIFLSEVLKKITIILPNELYLDSISFQKDDNLFTITGFAKTRDALILFKNELEKEKSFSEVNFPPTNWVRANEFNFFLTFKYLKK